MMSTASGVNPTVARASSNSRILKPQVSSAPGGATKSASPGVHQDVPVPALEVERVDRQVDPLAVIPQVGHDALVGLVDADRQGVDGVFAHDWRPEAYELQYGSGKS